MSTTSSHGMEDALAAFRRYWGYPDFRPGQRTAIEAVLGGRDALAILPTGGGKSVCYQVPAVVLPGLTLVVSPLIALMEDQVRHLNDRGIPAAYINSHLSARVVDQRWTDAEFGRYRLLYVAPERLQSDMFVARAGRLKVSLLAVDEAHCISEWGHHFRPAYREIANARNLLGGPPTLAVTATATPEVRRDIVEQLALRAPEVIVKGFDRPNIVWSIFRTVNKRAQVERVLDGVAGSGVIYSSTRRGVEEWADWLEREGVSAARYHAGLEAHRREAAQQAWIEGTKRVMVATNAFGMGIDKPDVRFVVHVDAPGSLESYYQEAGRAGRDGDTSYAILCVQEHDEATQRALIEQAHPDGKAVRAVYDAVCNLAQIPIGALPDGPVTVQAEKVARLAACPVPRVRTAIELLDRQGVWQVMPSRKHQALLRFSQPADAVRRMARGFSNEALAAFTLSILRTVHAEAFRDWWDIDLRLLERRTALGRERLVKGLDFLQDRGLLQWRPMGGTLRLAFNEPRASRLPVDDLAVRRARRRAESRLGDMLRYARSVTCRRHFLLSYFGEPSPAQCGRCDVCLGRHQAPVITPEDEPLMRRVLTNVEDDVPRAEWFREEPVDRRRLDGLVDYLIQERYVELVSALDETFALTEKARELMRQWRPRSDDGERSE